MSENQITCLHLVHGGWSAWSNYTDCSISCGGGGTQYRNRTCTNPKPDHGGRLCEGDQVQNRTCGDLYCGMCLTLYAF